MRQVEIIQKLGMPRPEAVSNINTVELAKALAREMGNQAMGRVLYKCTERLETSVVNGEIT